MREPLLLATVVLFILALIFRFIRGVRLGRRFLIRETSLPEFADRELKMLIDEARKPGKLRETLRDISGRAPFADSGRVRAAYYCAAGHLALTDLKRPGSSVGFYLRALREDPLCVDALQKLREILVAQKRPKRLEWTYWDILGRMDDSEVGGEMWIMCWSGLASLYSASPRTVRRADAMRKALSIFTSEDEDDVGEFPPVAEISEAKPQ